MVDMLNTYYLGVRGFIWLYFVISVFGFAGISAYWFRETIKLKYYSLRYPEKLLRIVIHYKSNLFKEYWRLIPDDNSFVIGKKHYEFNEKDVLKNKELFAYKKVKNTKILIDGIEYDYDSLKALKKRWSQYPEIHFIYNIPKPLIFDFNNKKIEFSSKNMNDFKENDLFVKLLTADAMNIQTNIMMLLLIGIAIGVGVILGRMMEWF